MRLLRAIALIFTAVLFFQCQKEISYIGNSDNPVLPAPITATVQGNVVDENGQAVAGVSVRVGNGSANAVTDQRGYFRINGASLDKHASLVTVDKAGYFQTYRTFSATSGTNQVDIKLIKRTLVGTVDAAAGGEVSLSNGSKITLPANGVVKASGAAYTGTINVYAAYIDPTASDIYERVPGSFMANDKDGNRVLLNSFGMLAVELESPAVEKLQIKSGSKAKLTTAIPAGMQASAPANIPLWYVDESTGLWKEDGSAAKQGNTYVGDVSHFTYWNCDMPLPTVHITGTLKTAAGAPLVNARVRVRPATGTYAGMAHGQTDSLGQFAGPVPSNMNLVLEVLDPCGTATFTQNIGPFAQNTALGNITVTLPNGPSVLTIKGKVVNCSNAGTNDGFALIIVNNRTHYASVDANGNFSSTYLVCNNPTTVEVMGVDETTQQQSTLASFAITGSLTDVGNISACGTSAAQFINYTLDGTAYSITLADSLNGWTQDSGTIRRTYIMGAHLANSVQKFISFQFSHTTNANGTYPITNLQVNNFFQNTIVAPTNVTITNFPASVGQFYEGSFSGSFTVGAATHTVTNGSFKVRRIQ